MLNQHYSSYGGQLYVRLAFGTHSRLCPIHPAFRVVVVVEKVDAYERLAPPLLNRFEKQVLERADVLLPHDLPLLARLHAMAQRFAAAGGAKTAVVASGGKRGGTGQASMRASFCGWHGDLLSSLILATRAREEAAQSSSGLGEGGEGGNGSSVAAAGEGVGEAALLAACWKQLLWVACPERVCRVLAQAELREAMKGEVGLDLGAAYFAHQQHSSLPAFARTMLEAWSADGVGASAMVATHSPLAPDAARELASECPWLHVTHVVLHELDQERGLRQQVADFFRGATDGAVLLLQCDPLGTGTRRIEHAKNILENARAKFVAQCAEAGVAAAEARAAGRHDGKAAADEPPTEAAGAAEPTALPEAPAAPAEAERARRGIHVVMLLHLPRGVANKWCASFDLRWRLAFVDDVRAANATGLPPVEHMVGKSMSDVVAGLEMKKVLALSFRPALARLRYSAERSNDQVREQVALLLAFLEQPFFVALMAAAVAEMIAKSKTFALDVASAAHEDEGALARSGTFQGALHAQVVAAVSTTLAVALSHADRNGTLRLLAEPALQDLWARLFEASFRQMQVFETASAKARHGPLRGRAGVDVASDGHGGSDFAAAFPFSFFVDKHFGALRALSEGTSEEALAQQFGLLGLGLEGNLDPPLLQRYVRDLCRVHFKAVAGMPAEAQAALLFRLLEFHGKGPPATLAALHFRLWAAEQPAALLFALLDAVPNAQAAVAELLASPAAAAMDASERTGAALAAVAAAVYPGAGWGAGWEDRGAGYDEVRARVLVETIASVKHH